MMPLIAFVLPHLVKQGNDTQNRESEQAHHAERNSPTLTIIKGLDKHHEAKDGQQDGGCKKWKLHKKTI